MAYISDMLGAPGTGRQSAASVTKYFRSGGRLVELNAERPAEEVFYDLCSSATGLTCGA
jgi:hypothetical protein